MSSDVATERRVWTLIISENAFYGGFFVLYFVSSLLLLQRRRHLKKQAKNGFAGGGLDSEDHERLQTMRFWEITGGIMFVVLTVVRPYVFFAIGFLLKPLFYSTGY